MADKPNTDNWKEREIGALWKKQSQTQSFLSGKLKIDGKEVEIVVFKNKFKGQEGTSPNAPDFRVYLSEKRATPSPAPAAKTSGAATAAAAQPDETDIL